MCAGKRGIDEDWALGEVEEIAGDLRSQDTSGERHLEQDDCEQLRLRYCRVYFDVNSSCQERSKSTGARYGWDRASVVNV
jgi:hypothetical protein